MDGPQQQQDQDQNDDERRAVHVGAAATVDLDVRGRPRHAKADCHGVPPGSKCVRHALVPRGGVEHGVQSLNPSTCRAGDCRFMTCVDACCSVHNDRERNSLQIGSSHSRRSVPTNRSTLALCGHQLRREHGFGLQQQPDEPEHQAQHTENPAGDIARHAQEVYSSSREADSAPKSAWRKSLCRKADRVFRGDRAIRAVDGGPMVGLPE